MVQVSPLAVTGGLSAAWFVAKPLMEVTTSWVGACCLQVQFLVSLFPRLKRGGAVRGLPRSTKIAFQVLSPAGAGSSKAPAAPPLWVDSPAGV